MYIYINSESGVFADEAVGVFDIDNTTRGSKITEKFLQKAKITDETGGDIPRSFIVKKDGSVIITALNTATVLKRLKEFSALQGRAV